MDSPCAVPPPRALPRYPVEIRDGEIWINPNSASLNIKTQKLAVAGNG